MLAGDQHISIRNLIVQFVNSVKINMEYRKVYFNMGNPMGRELAN